MIRGHSRSGKRSAFTLVELMVVILIIAILVSLLSSAVIKAMGKIPEVQTSSEIAQMSVALQAFMIDYGLTDPPPSVLLLDENVGPTPTFSPPYSAGDPSYNFLQKVFGRNLVGTGPAGVPATYWVDWNGDNVPNGPWVLEGEQCLVFYLSGIANQGFSTSNINPSQPGGKRKGPYYTFQTSRLIPGSIVNPLSLNAFPVYIDAWQAKSVPHPAPYANGVPYAYFSSLGINNSGYASLYPYGTPFVPPIISNLKACQSVGAAAYYIAAGQFTYPNTYQIISAGKNGVFGNGFWSPAAGPLVPGTVPPQADVNGADDQANFSSTLLGNGQN